MSDFLPSPGDKVEIRGKIYVVASVGGSIVDPQILLVRPPATLTSRFLVTLRAHAEKPEGPAISAG